MSLTYADVHGELIETLDADLRAVVRAEGVDPQRDASVVRRLAAWVVGDHDQRSLTGAVLPVLDPDAVIEELVARVSGFGALQRYLDDGSVEEIWINDPSRVFVARSGRHELTSTILSSAQVQELVERMLKSSGRRIDVSQPFVDAMLPEGHRLHVVLEGISRGFSAVNIHKKVSATVSRCRARKEGQCGPRSMRESAWIERGPVSASSGSGMTALNWPGRVAGTLWRFLPTTTSLRTPADAGLVTSLCWSSCAPSAATPSSHGTWTGFTEVPQNLRSSSQSRKLRQYRPSPSRQANSTWLPQRGGWWHECL